MTDLVLVEKHRGIARVTLNRPDALNALSSGLRRALTAAFDALYEDRSTQVVILTGAGRAFTVGLDLKELGGEIQAGDGGVPDTALRSRDPAEAMARFDRPIIGAINGFAITGGFELALLCDLLICSTEARFADTHARVGVVPGWGLSQRLPRMIGINRAKELSLTGNFLSAETACDWGLANRVVAPEELLPVCEQIAEHILTTDEATRAEILRIMDAGWITTLDAGLGIERSASRAHRVRPEDVAARRAAVQSRGREQR